MGIGQVNSRVSSSVQSYYNTLTLHAKADFSWWYEWEENGDNNGVLRPDYMNWDLAHHLEGDAIFEEGPMVTVRDDRVQF